VKVVKVRTGLGSASEGTATLQGGGTDVYPGGMGVDRRQLSVGFGGGGFGFKLCNAETYCAFG